MKYIYNDWQNTQNNKYLTLLKKRLDQKILIWVNQFCNIIKNHYSVKYKKKLIINDFGCNVGHFYRGCLKLKFSFLYYGYDISKTYIEVAKKIFKTNCKFKNIDFSKKKNLKQIVKSDISVISATLEHINSYKNALENIFLKTNELIILRTFVGKKNIKEYCHTIGAKKNYLIREFTLRVLTENKFQKGWKYNLFIDSATKGQLKFTCNKNKIPRRQIVIVFCKK
jgi:hypothetical protein